MREVVKKQWAELPPIWNALISKNANATSFQSHEFLTFTGKGKPYRKEPFRTLGLKQLNLVLYSDGIPVAIAPLLIKKHKKKTMVYLRGHFTAASSLDFIYADLSYTDFEFLMDSIKSLLGAVSFFLDRVSDRFPTSGYLIKYLAGAQIEEHECFAVPIPLTEDDWYKTLHKSVRRNLVTHRNRMEKEQIRCETRFFTGERISDELHKEMMLVYADRFLVKNSFNFGPLKPVVKKALQAFLLKDKMTQWLHNADNCFHAVVFMNGEVAAFTSGLVFKDKRILLSRLAINTKYAKYGPGGVLIQSTVRHVIAQNKEAGLGIRLLDFSQGGHGGMAYKSAYGGALHHEYTFTE